MELWASEIITIGISKAVFFYYIMKAGYVQKTLVYIINNVICLH